MDRNGFPFFQGSIGPQGPQGPKGDPGSFPVSSATFTTQASIGTVTSGQVAEYAGSDKKLKRKADDQVVHTLADDSDLAGYVPLTGATLAGGLAFAGNNATGISTLQFAQTAQLTTIDQASIGAVSAGTCSLYTDLTTERLKKRRGSDNSVQLLTEDSQLATLVTGPGSSTNNDLASFSGTTGYLLADSAISSANVVQNTGATVTSGNLAVFSGTSGRLLVDGGVPPSGAYLPLSGGTMSGAIAMGTHAITGVTVLGFSGGVQVGTGSGTTNANEVAVGQNATVSASGGIALGNGTLSSGSNGISIGSNAGTTANIAIGPSSSASVGSGTISIGSLSACLQTESVAIGDSAANNTAHSVLLGDTAVVNIRANSSICDLGSSGANFQDAYLSRNIVGSSLTTAVNSITSGPLSAVSGNVVTFNGASGRLIQDSGATLSSYLPVSGGTMSGDIKMGSNNIIGIGTLTAQTNIVISGSNTSYITEGNAATAAASHEIVIGNSASADASSTGAVVIGHSASAATSSTSVSIGSGSQVTANNAISLGPSAAATALDAIAIGASASNGTAHSCIVGDAAIVNLRPNSAVCDLGTSGANFQDAYLSRNIVGSTLTTAVNSITSGPSSAVSGNVVTFNGSTGRLIQDSGSALSSYLPLAGGTMTGAMIANAATISVGSSTKGFGSYYTSDGTVCNFLQYAMFDNPSISSTSLTTIFTGSVTQGSLTVHPGNGYSNAQWYEMTVPFSLTMNNNSAMNLSVQVDGSDVLTLAPAFASATFAAVPGVYIIQVCLNPASTGTCRVSSKRDFSGFVPDIKFNNSTPAFTNANHTFDIKISFPSSTTGNTFVPLGARIVCMGREQ